MKNILIVDDDKTFCEVLSGSLRKRGFNTAVAHSVIEGIDKAEDFTPEYALIDLKMPGASGLEIIPELLHINPEVKIVMLTGYANVATAVEAIKLGAIHYLTKPIGTEEILEAFNKESGNPKIPVPEEISLDKTEREHILSVFNRNQGNVSKTARELGLHRRTLQRKLEKMKV